MKSALRLFTLGLILLLPPSVARAWVDVSPITDKIVCAGDSLNVNVVAVDPDGGSITLTGSLPSFVALNDPTSGSGIVATTLTMKPLTTDIGDHSGSVTATSGEASDTAHFHVTVVAADANRPPRVTAPALITFAGGTLEFEVTASDADDEAITSLTALGLPSGASFTPNANFTSGIFSWTPDPREMGNYNGHYDVIFAAANAQADSSTTHIWSQPSNIGPVSIEPIADVSMAEGDSVRVSVIATDPDMATIDLSTTLPSFATLDAPTQSTGAESLLTTITIMPGSGAAGTYPASVTAISGADTSTVTFTITVTGSALPASATLIGSYNVHKKFLCFKVKPVDGSFDLLDVALSSIVLSFHGDSISTVRPTHLAYDCEDGDGDDGECDSCGDEESYRYVSSGGGKGHGHGDGEEGDGDGDGEDNDHGDGEPDSCAPAHIMACFSMSDIQALFQGVPLPDSLAAATIEGELTGGGTFVAWIGGKHVTDQHNNGDNGDGMNGKGQPDAGNGKLAVRVRPNPMNPKADISFTLNQPGPVRVAIYDLAGRLVKTIHEGNFPAGENTVSWSGSTGSGARAASGVYFVKVEIRGVSEVQRVTVVK